jgi:hypothetical protein
VAFLKPLNDTVNAVHGIDYLSSNRKYPIVVREVQTSKQTVIECFNSRRDALEILNFCSALQDNAFHFYISGTTSSSA